MAITTQNPVSVENPEIPFDKFLIYLSISPILENNNTEIEGSMTIRGVPFRILPDGTVETVPRAELIYEETISRIYAKAAEDPALAQAMYTISLAIQDFLTARGA